VGRLISYCTFLRQLLAIVRILASHRSSIGIKGSSFIVVGSIGRWGRLKIGYFCIWWWVGGGVEGKLYRTLRE
jgi:hypothetical protein